MQNRAKTGKVAVADDESGPTAARKSHGSGSFDHLETTAVGGSSGTDGRGDDPGVEPPAAGERSGRVVTPAGGGVPALSTRTQLGLGDSVRSALESARVPVPDSLKPLRPLRPTPTVARAAVSAEISGSGAASEPSSAAPFAADHPAASPPTEPAPAPEGVPVDSAESGSLAAETTAVGGATVTSSATGAVSEAVKAAGTGPLAGNSGAVFDPASGPITNVSSGPVESAAPRPARRPTPASGRLAALLAESRKKTGRHATLEAAGLVAASATPAPVTPSPSAPVAFSPVAPSSGDSAAAVVEGEAHDTTTVRVPGAAMAEKKVPAFAATLMGLPAPDVNAAAATTAWGPGRLRDSGLGGGVGRNTPLPVDGDATERNPTSTDDLTTSATGWRRRKGTAERKRITDVIDVVRPSKPLGAKAALVISAAMIAAIVIVFIARGIRSTKTAQTAVVAPAAKVVAPPAAPIEQAAPAAATNSVPGEAAEQAAKGQGAVEQPASSASDDTAGAAERQAAAPPSPEPPAPATAEREAGDSKRTVAHEGESESRPKAARSRRTPAPDVASAPKVRRSSERRARAAGPAVAGTGFEPAHPRLAQPSRLAVPSSDPDGTLPLSSQ